MNPHPTTAPTESASRHDPDADGFHSRLDHQLSRLEQLLHLNDSSSSQLEPKPLPAWRCSTQGEHRAAVITAIVVAVILLSALPSRVSMHPRMVIPALAVLLLFALVVANPSRLERESRWLRALSLGLIGLLSVANAASGMRLVVDLSRAQGIKDPGALLLTGAAIWLTNVIVFSLWYWESDRGGPVQRAMGSRQHPDFLFPQMDHPDLCVDHWEPLYVDYLYLSFTNATAFSPTDVAPLSRWAKLTMMMQSSLSVVTVALVIARAVNILG